MLAALLLDYLDGEYVVDKGVDGFVDVAPDQPDTLVVVRQNGGPPPDGIHPYDTVRVQVWVRGDRDPRTAHDLSYAIFDELHGLSSVDVGDPATRIVSCFAQQPPTFIGRDDSQRIRYSHNYLIHVKNATDSREGW